MQTFDNELERLWREGVLTKDMALSFATNAPNLALKMSGIAGAEREAGVTGGPEPEGKQGTEAVEEAPKKKGLGAFAAWRSQDAAKPPAARHRPSCPRAWTSRT